MGRSFQLPVSYVSSFIPRWGVVQPVGHLTVNEDGEGSNPSAPANLIDSPLFVFRFSSKIKLSSNWT
jgi:hypothetical protein